MTTPLSLTVTVLGATTALAALVTQAGMRLPRILAALLGLAAILQAATEGWRPAMLPVHAGVALAIGLAFLPWRMPALLRVGGAAAALVGLVAPAALTSRLPAPGGPYPVGTALVGAIAGAGTPVVQLWYPAASGGAAALYRTDGARLREHLVEPRARRDAPAAAGAPLPLVIYVPGWGGQRQQNTALLEALASSGHIVAASDPWDGGPGDATGRSDLAAPLDLRTEASFAAAREVGERNARRQARHVGRMLDALLRLAGTGHEVARRIDPTRIVLLGYSFGGAIAAEVAASDPRVTLLVNMDGWTFTDAYARGIRQPHLVLWADEPFPGEAALRSADPIARHTARMTIRDTEMLRANFARHGGWLVKVPGSDHAAFSDAPWTAQAGAETPQQRAWRLSARLILAFLASHGGGAPGRRPDGSPFAGVELPPGTGVESWPVPGHDPPRARPPAAWTGARPQEG